MFCSANVYLVIANYHGTMARDTAMFRVCHGVMKPDERMNSALKVANPLSVISSGHGCVMPLMPYRVTASLCMIITLQAQPYCHT